MRLRLIIVILFLFLFWFACSGSLSKTDPQSVFSRVYPPWSSVVSFLSLSGRLLADFWQLSVSLVHQNDSFKRRFRIDTLSTHWQPGPSLAYNKDCPWSAKITY